ncbi:hypothetical protein BC941DRAFT_417876 [Chlamydoabsidia padenii]|nr:hypothetical protein BC941DRAFT_417876 [Chlamydoabsidia padenii]
MSFDKNNSGDFINRINRLLNNNDKHLPQDDELAHRFKKVFDSEPTTNEQQKLNYTIPKDAADEELEQYLLEAGLSDGDDDDDYLAHILNDQPNNYKKITTPTTHDETLATWQDAFLGEDSTLDDQGQVLLNQLKDQVAVENKYASLEQQQDEDLERRYLALKDTVIKDSPNTSSSSLPPGRVPKPLAMTDLHDEMDDWCCVCNEDATIECQDCDHDRFCAQCFYEGHQSDTADYGFSKHRAKKYTK